MGAGNCVLNCFMHIVSIYKINEGYILTTSVVYGVPLCLQTTSAPGVKVIISHKTS